jgi:hypothetical protein
MEERGARLEAVILDMDGVVTDTAKVHARAWKHLFDEFLRERSETTGAPFEPFDAVRDYLDFVDGKPRYEGVRSFLRSRDIELPEGGPDEGPDAMTVIGLGNRKDADHLGERRHGPCRDRTCDLGIKSSHGRSRAVSGGLAISARGRRFRRFVEVAVSLPPPITRAGRWVRRPWRPRPPIRGSPRAMSRMPPLASPPRPQSERPRRVHHRASREVHPGPPIQRRDLGW